MLITESDRTKIQSLLDMISGHIKDVDNVSVQMKDDFDIEVFLPYLIDNKFPLAVDPQLIADPDSEEDKASRANGILNVVIGQPITGKFLDFGCGEGHVVAEMSLRTSLAVGYDIVDQGWQRFRKTDTMVFTTSWDEVVKNGPYDFALLYDVLDHMKDEADAIDNLKKLRTVLGNNSKVFVRNHPWCSRHGTHLYLSTNKAFLHMFLDEKALDEMGYKYLHTIKLIHPLQTYQKWFESAGFAYLSENVMPEDVEPFFKQPAIAKLIKRHWKSSYQEKLASGEEFPEYQMRQQFVDYFIVKK